MVFTMVFFFSCTTHRPTTSAIDLRGIWKLTKGSGGLIPTDSVTQIKLITDNYFFWYNADFEGNINFGAGGTYTLKDGIYTETLTSALPMMSHFLGKKAVYEVKIEGNKMYIFGTLDATIKITEVWERIVDSSK